MDHKTFLSILQQRFGVADSALNSFDSFMYRIPRILSIYRLEYPTQLQFTVVFLKVPLFAQ